MSFDYSTLITDRARSDSDTLKTLLSKPMAEWTAEERTAFNGAVMRGSYDYTDLNRVDACLEDLVARLDRVGCNVPGYERLKIERAVTPSSRLPEGYAEVQYIQSTETQWIDTGFKPNQNTRIKMDCNVIGFNSGDAFLFGARIASGNTTFCLAADDANTRWFALYGNAVQNPTGTCTGKHSIDFNQNVLTLDEKNFTFAKTTFQSSYNLLLFATITNGNVDSQRGKMAIYSCQIYDNGNLIRDFVPCVDPTGNAGLYDLVDGKFYGNAGTGSFTAGPVVTWDEPTQTLDPYTWYESDVPVPSQMARYRANVAAVRAVLRLPEGTPGVPEIMRRLTVTEANSIEAILLALNLILNKIHTAVRHCGVTVCGSKGVRA